MEAIFSWIGDRLLDDDDPVLDDFPGLAAWWSRAVSLWQLHRSERSTLSLRQQIDHQGKLSAQFPIATERVVYTKGRQPACGARVTGEAVIENGFYWAPVFGPEEGRYLCAILDSEARGERVAPLQSVGQFGRRHFDKYVFAIPFPTFDPLRRKRPPPRDLVPDESPAWIRTERTTLGDVSGVLRGDHSEYQDA